MDFDFDFDFGDFSCTSVVVTALSDTGKQFFASMFGKAAVSVEMPKTKGYDFLVYVQQKGFKA